MSAMTISPISGQKAEHSWEQQRAEEQSLRDILITEDLQQPARRRGLCLTCVAGGLVAVIAVSALGLTTLG